MAAAAVPGGSRHLRYAMTESVEPLILDLLEWLETRERSYAEVMEAWRTSCPRLPVWEDANDRRLVKHECVNGRSVVRVTSDGRALLEARRPWQRPETTQSG
jgi:hypothetical protein